VLVEREPGPDSGQADRPPQSGRVLLRRGDLPVVAFWPDKAILSRPASTSRHCHCSIRCCASGPGCWSTSPFRCRPQPQGWPGSRSGAVDSVWAGLVL